MSGLDSSSVDMNPGENSGIDPAITVPRRELSRRELSRRELLRTGTLSLGTLSLGTLSLGTLSLGTGLSTLLTACGGSSSTVPGGPISPDMSLVQRWVPDQLTPGYVRLPISLADNAGLLNSGPDVLTGKIINYLDNSVFADSLSAQRLSIGPDSPPFWVFSATIDEPNVYSLVIDGGPEDGAALQIRENDSTPVPRVGQTLPSIETPTVDNARGVEVICTRSTPCPFHDVTLAQALASGKRVVFLVGTPAHCQTAVCAPVLDALIDLAATTTDVIFVHADVYADKAATVIAPSVQELSLTFEPVLWVTNTSGTITHRFEGVWHDSEIASALGI